MKHVLLCVFSIIFLFSALPNANAGFIVKKKALVAIAENNHTELKNAKALHTLRNIKHIFSRPYYPFAYGGWIGYLAIIFGICGFFYGGFAIAAVLFGFWGMGRRHKNKGLAIAGLVLGITSIVLALTAGFMGFPIF